MSKSRHARIPLSPRLRKLALLGATALLALGAGVASAQKTPKAPLPKLLVLGASAQTAAPACPANPCQAIGRVTGFQTKIGNTKAPFVAPFDGRIVAWSIKLSAPGTKPIPPANESQIDFFNNFYGGPPSAQISILKPVKKTKGAYKLRNESPVEGLTDVLGQTTTFTLKAPIPIRTGQVVALTVPTWAPAFGIGLPKDNKWRASRQAGKCNLEADIKAGTPHKVLRQERSYGCAYPGARLLYSATLVRGVVGAAPKP